MGLSLPLPTQSIQFGIMMKTTSNIVKALFLVAFLACLGGCEKASSSEEKSHGHSHE